MSKWERNFMLGLGAYLLMFMVTFGYSWWRVPSDDPAGRSFGAACCAIAWPLYWSVQLLEPKR